MSRPLRIAREALATIVGNRLRFFMMIAASKVGLPFAVSVVCCSAIAIAFGI